MRLPTRLLRWPFGIALTAWGYMWRTTPMHRREVSGSWTDDMPPQAAGIDDRGILPPQDGSGPLFRRRYRARIANPRSTAAELMRELQADPNRVAPGRVAHFEKVAGDEGEMRVGDEFRVRMPGPWDGPIRVVEVTPTSFRSATLAGHLEAGQIEWRAADEDGHLRFEIESWSRPGDRLSHVLHDRLRMAKEVQLYMWTSVVERVAGRVEGRLDGGIDIETRRAEPPDA